MTKKSKGKGRIKVVYRDAAGAFKGIRIADPAVKPRGTTVKKIREAVAAAKRA